MCDRDEISGSIIRACRLFTPTSWDESSRKTRRAYSRLSYDVFAGISVFLARDADSLELRGAISGRYVSTLFGESVENLDPPPPLSASLCAPRSAPLISRDIFFFPPPLFLSLCLSPVDGLSHRDLPSDTRIIMRMRTMKLSTDIVETPLSLRPTRYAVKRMYKLLIGENIARVKVKGARRGVVSCVFTIITVRTLYLRWVIFNWGEGICALRPPCSCVCFPYKYKNIQVFLF